MEDPGSWGPVERVIYQAKLDWAEQAAKGVFGPSAETAGPRQRRSRVHYEVWFIADALRKAGLLTEET